MKRILIFFAAFGLNTTWAQTARVESINDSKLYQIVDSNDPSPMLLLYRYSDSKRFPALEQRLLQFQNQFENEVGQKMKIYSLAISQNPKSVQQIGIRSSPTLVALKNGEVLSTFELVIDDNTDEVPAWYYCSLKINPKQNCISSIIPKIDFLKVPETVQATSGVVLMKIAAKFCIPCEQMRPIIEQMARDKKDGLTVFSVAGHVPGLSEADKKRESDLYTEYRLNGAVPALILFKDGKFVNSRVGYSKEEGRAGIEAWIQESLKKLISN